LLILVEEYTLHDPSKKHIILAYQECGKLATYVELMALEVDAHLDEEDCKNALLDEAARLLYKGDTSAN
jgi:hypothetical protein